MSELNDRPCPADAVHVRTHRVGGATVVSATGEIDVGTIAPLDREVAAACDTVTAPGPLVIDLSGVEFLASAGISLLSRAQQRCAGRGVLLRTVVSTPGPRRVLSVTGMDRVLVVAPSLDDALDDATSDTGA